MHKAGFISNFYDPISITYVAILSNEIESRKKKANIGMRELVFNRMIRNFGSEKWPQGQVKCTVPYVCSLPYFIDPEALAAKSESGLIYIQNATIQK